MEKNQKKNVVIYVRVSTKEQVDEGNSLNTQEKLCREYCEKHGYEVVHVYIEQGESAKTALRTELQKMLLFCSDKKNKTSAVIIYKLDRLSRNTDDYSQIRLLLKRYGVEIKSITEYFENTPQGKFMENMFANVAQFDNDVRAERCAGGMKDAMREGRYVWMAPVGYDNVKVGGRSTIAQNPIMGPLIKQTFEMVAKNTHATEDVRKIMTELGLRIKNGKPLSKQYFYNMLKNRVYTGVIEKFGESHKGLFDPIVDELLFNQVQKVLSQRGKKQSQYKLDSEDFPLRRFVTNPEGRKLTGSWSKGRSKKYPFYRFEVKGSNYNRDKFEKAFMQYMDQFAVNQNLIQKLKSKLSEKLDNATKNEHKDSIKLSTHIDELKVRQNALIEKNLKGVISDSILSQQLALIEQEIFNSQIKLASIQETEIDFNELLDYVKTYLETPSIVWKEAKLDTKLRLQWFQFPQGVIFENGIYGTTQISCVFKTKEAFLPLQSTMVDPRRFELLTFTLQKYCSTS